MEPNDGGALIHHLDLSVGFHGFGFLPDAAHGAQPAVLSGGTGEW
jgi:hypothetical protein